MDDIRFQILYTQDKKNTCAIQNNRGCQEDNGNSNFRGDQDRSQGNRIREGDTLFNCGRVSH